MMTPPPSGCNLCSGVRVYRFLPCRLHVSMHFSKADLKEIKEKRKGRVRQRGGEGPCLGENIQILFPDG